MRIYVAGRYQSYRKARDVIDRLKVMGHEITHDWTRTDAFDITGQAINIDNSVLGQQKLREYAVADLEGVRQADLIVLCADDSMAGAYIEVGYGLAHGCEILVVAHNRWTIFYELAQVTHFATYEDLFAHTEKLA